MNPAMIAALRTPLTYDVQRRIIVLFWMNHNVRISTAPVEPACVIKISRTRARTNARSVASAQCQQHTCSAYFRDEAEAVEAQVGKHTPNLMNAALYLQCPPRDVCVCVYIRIHTEWYITRRIGRSLLYAPLSFSEPLQAIGERPDITVTVTVTVTTRIRGKSCLEHARTRATHAQLLRCSLGMRGGALFRRSATAHQLQNCLPQGHRCRPLLSLHHRQQQQQHRHRQQQYLTESRLQKRRRNTSAQHDGWECTQGRKLQPAMHLYREGETYVV